MKLYLSFSSPFARKVRMAAIELELEERIDYCEVTPLEDPDSLVALNPTSKVPVLETESCEAIYDSRVIVSYLASLKPENDFYPASTQADRWRVLSVAAQCEAVIDAAVALRLEALRPVEQQSPFWKKRWADQIFRNLDALPARIDENRTSGRFLEMSAVVGLAYLDFRHPELSWRHGRPELAALIEKWNDRASFDRTRFPSG